MIRNTPELTQVCEALRQGGVAAVDTEFVWSRTYRPRLGLVQIGSAAGEGWAIDCLSGTSPAPLGALLADAGTVKILHDAQQDLEHLFHYTHNTPKNVFDTRLAAGFAGFSSTIGLQKLLEEALNVGLPKTETLTDWCRRPLTDAQIEYALDDVRYLANLRLDLLARAAKLGTSDYLAEELRRYDDPSRYEDPEPNEVWLRIKGIGRLSPRECAFLRELAAARESTARTWNVPRNWLSDDSSLLAIAQDPSDLRFRHRLRNRGQRDTLGGIFAAAVKRAAALPEDALPAPPDRWIPTEVRDRADDALAFLRQRAEEVHIDAPLFASRAVLTDFLNDPDNPDNPLASGWRHELAGREIASRFAPPSLF